MEIKHTWNGTLLDPQDAVELQLETKSGYGLFIKINAPRYGDALPPSPSGWPFDGLSSYEVVHLFLLGENDTKTLELQFGPMGHYAVIFWTNRTKLGDLQREITYKTNGFNSVFWEGEAFIPLAYLPARVILLRICYQFKSRDVCGYIHKFFLKGLQMQRPFCSRAARKSTSNQQFVPGQIE